VARKSIGSGLGTVNSIVEAEELKLFAGGSERLRVQDPVAQMRGSVSGPSLIYLRDLCRRVAVLEVVDAAD